MPRELQPCGTFGAYLRHVLADEPADAACREASRLKSAAYRAANPERTRAYDRDQRARKRQQSQEVADVV